LLAAILRDEPRPLDAPHALARLVEHCLEKRPECRFQSARDLVFALRAVERELSSAGGGRVGSGPELASVAAATPTPRPGFVSPKSIAVLPFRNLGGGGDT